MSEEIIKILDTLAEKFGLAIDWTSTNVMPYLQQLCGKYITYEIATSVVWMLIGIGLLFIGKYVIDKAKYCWKKYQEDWHSMYDLATTLLGILAGCLIIGGIIMILFQTFDIVTCITFPEKIIINELMSISQNLSN